MSWLELRLSTSEADRTTLQPEHIARVDPDRWRELGPGAVGVGWDMGLVGLGQHLAGGELAGAEQAQQWVTSPDGQEFITRSSDGWCRASIASGEDDATARAAAARTTAACTGAPPSDDPVP